MNWYLNLKMKSKLMWGFATTILLTIILGLSGMMNFDSVDKADHLLYADGVVARGYAGDLGEAFNAMRAELLELAIETDQSRNAQHKAAIDEQRANLNATWEKIWEIAKGFPMKEDLTMDVKNKMQDYFKVVDVFLGHAMANRTQEALSYLKSPEMLPFRQAFYESLKTIEGAMRGAAVMQLEANEKIFLRSNITMIVCVAIDILLSIIVGAYISNLIVRGLKKLVVDIDLVAKGDLTVVAKAETGDEIGTIMNHLGYMVGELRRIVTGVNQGVEGVASGSTQLSAAAEQMSSTTERIAVSADKQRAEAEGMAAAMTELSASIDEVSNSATESLTQLDAALEATNQGNEAGESTKNA
ncbi:MAG: methyl-accepting chemotaxis protein, partial [Holophagales bacterium]|nr:methyl-accepting chemotaxis protein [Holophagales bacterium]